jgi:hypothetical protein
MYTILLFLSASFLYTVIPHSISLSGEGLCEADERRAVFQRRLHPAGVLLPSLSPGGRQLGQVLLPDRESEVGGDVVGTCKKEAVAVAFEIEEPMEQKARKIANSTFNI